MIVFRNSIVIAVAFVFVMMMPALAGEYNIVGAGGYDLVSYHQESGPMRGSGHYVVNHEGVPYLFVSVENMEMFKADPAKYLPAYGGFCAYGVTKGKKFYSDPEVWKIVDGMLYLNLDKDVQRIWETNIPDHIKEADTEWIMMHKSMSLEE